MTTERAAPAWAPAACTLPTAQQPLRLAEFDDLFTSTLRSANRLSATHLRLHLNGPGTLEDTVRDLAALESQCCSFFTFTTTPVDRSTLTFDIEVPEAHIDVLDALAARATARPDLP